MPEGHEPSQLPSTPPFRPVHDRLLRIAFGVLVVGLFVALAAWLDWRESRWTQIARVPEQPIPFSHKHHVADLGIDCRYCHTGVEKSAFAGLPSARTCMTCHSQIWKDAPVLAPLRASAATGKPILWKRVTELPDFVYFNHSAHVTRGVACVSCHGDLSAMPQVYEVHKLDMSWCLDCHRHTDSRLVPPGAVTDPAAKPGVSLTPLRPLDPVQKARLTNCSTCHR
jgi:hypothetical protein